MTAEELKASVLQMAMEGKLVPQSDDEPAVDIDAEELEDVPFAIPDKWKWVRLSSISFKLQYGYTASAQKSGDAKLLRITDITTNGINWKTVPFCSIDIKDIEKFRLLNDDILIARTGGTIGKSYIIKSINCISVFASYLIRVRLHKDIVNPLFIDIFLKTPLYWCQLHDGTRGTGQPNVNAKTLSHLLIPLPPLEEQRRIVEKLEEILPVIEQYGKAHDALQTMEKELPGKLRAALLQEAISGRLVPQRDDEPAVDIDAEEPDDVPFAIPDKWKWVRLCDLGTFVSGRTPKTHELSEKGKIPYFKVSDMNRSGNERKMIYTELYLKENTTRVYKKNTIIYPKNGGAVFTNKRRLLVKDSIIDLNTGGFLPGKMLYIEYAFQIFLSLDFRKISKGTALPTIDQTQLRNYLIPLPPLEEQRRIVEKLNELLPSVEAMERLYQQ